MSIRFVTLFPSAVIAFTCASSIPAASCSILALLFSQQRQTSLPTLTTPWIYLPSSAVAPRPFSPATLLPVASDWTPAETLTAATPVSSSFKTDWIAAETQLISTPTSSPVVSDWTPAAEALPVTTPAPAPNANPPIQTFAASQWSTCVDSSPWVCQGLLCTSLLGRCTAWVEGDGPPRDLCIDGRPVRCEGSECLLGEDADDDISASVCNGWVDPRPTPAWEAPPRATPEWSSNPYSTLPTGYLGGVTVLPDSGFVTVTVVGSDLGALGGLIEK
jgi:hypothetical protein